MFVCSASYTDSNKRYTHSFLATDAIRDAMAKFVLAGKTDCPHYAKAELLADSLQRCLPNFRIHKISVLPHAWKEWLEDTCTRNGWKHEQSPLVWRELVDQGGKAMLLGGFSDFLEHCQDYYSVTSDMPTDIMLSVASENLETKMNSIVEEQHRVSLIKPLHIWLSSALSPTGHFLIPNLLSAEVFPNTSAISLHLLNLEGKEEQLQWLRMVTENLALPLLYQVTIHTDLEQAFKEADVILLQDECWSDDSDTEDEEEMKKKVKRISDRYREYGQLIDTRANREVKVIVSGDSFVNLRCSLLLDNVNLIDSNQFVTVATQLENEARAIIARKLKVRTSDVTHVIVWGNISGSFYIDLQRAKVFNYDGPIKGPAYFSQPAKNILQERKWLETDLQELVRCQRAAVASKTCRAAPMSLANGILEVLKAWNGICGPDEIFSLGVLCPGDYNLPDGIVLSVPVIFTDRKWSVLSDVTREDNLKERLEIAASELRQEKDNTVAINKKRVDGRLKQT
ncbi:putative malate dehydrogenase 1B [Trematomus bernacchii]|uniref:putative malate dehydrogenase 1B n=1 Tax=Trematomus bernacchii TaxID=40690 RepID=UPI00146A04A6|nr:putative malate dehydrogenase 1B [Trematomus bernacchii]